MLPYLFLLSSHIVVGQFQATSFPQVPCDVNYNTSLYPRYLQITAEDLANNQLNTTGIFRKTPTYNGYPVYRKDFLYLDLGQSMHFPGESRSKGVLRQSGLSIFLDNDGHWTMQEDGYNIAYKNTDPFCSHLVNTASLWRYSSNTGLSMQIRLKISEFTAPATPDFYQIEFAPLHINGFYAKTATFSSEAPIYRKPGLGNMQNYLFLYKGSWMVAKDPLSTSLTYRMFQQSQGSLSLEPGHPWFVVNNDGTIEEVATIRVSTVQQSYPPSYTLNSNGPVAEFNPSTLGHYMLTNTSFNNVPVYIHEQRRHYLYQNVEGSWVVSTSLATVAGRELLSQDSKGSPLPRSDVNWRFFSNGWNDDPFLVAIGEATPETRAAQLRLGLSIGFPIAAAIILLMLVICVCCCLKKRQSRSFEDQNQNATLKKISKL